ncbi:MAG: superoxide dismutase [Planctomycetes bacterium]|nr:superoxide dismutase [Planctomycetota bacterium]
MSRRDALKGIVTGSAAILAAAAGGSSLLAQAGDAPKTEPPRPSAKYEVKPLRFDPAKLSGISEKLIVSHHDNNYAAAVKNLNATEAQLAQVNKDTPGFVVGGIKMHELMYSNSIILHEHYFDNLGGNGKITPKVEKALSEAFAGSWEQQFRQAGASLGGGSGWMILYYNLHSGQLRNYWSNNHTLALGFGVPLLVMDMYEHAYQMDYGAAHAKYIDAFFTNVNWEEVEKRYDKALALAKALKG